MNIKSVMLVLLGCASLPLLAQNTPSQSPSANQMIEQLKPNTRSLRNLKVEAAAPPATAAPVTAQPAVSQVIAEPVPTPAAEAQPKHLPSPCQSLAGRQIAFRIWAGRSLPTEAD